MVCSCAQMNLRMSIHWGSSLKPTRTCVAPRLFLGVAHHPSSGLSTVLTFLARLSRYA